MITSSDRQETTRLSQQ